MSSDIIFCSNTLIKKFEALLSRKDLPPELGEIVSDYLESLKLLKTTANEADVLLNETKPIIYAKLNPDEGHFEANAVKEKMKYPVPRNNQKQA